MTKVLVGLFMTAVLVTGFLTYKRWEGQPPQIAFDRDFKALGRTPSFSVTVNDAGTGLKHVAIHLKQKDQDIALADEELKAQDKSKTYDVGKLITEKYKIQDGPATLTVAASDHAFRNLLKGNQTTVTKD